MILVFVCFFQMGLFRPKGGRVTCRERGDAEKCVGRPVGLRQQQQRASVNV
jgi:hypothetical protein